MLVKWASGRDIVGRRASSDGPPTPAILTREAAKKCDSTFLGTSSTVIYLRILAGRAFSRPSSFMMLCSLRSTPTRVPPSAHWPGLFHTCPSLSSKRSPLGSLPAPTVPLPVVASASRPSAAVGPWESKPTDRPHIQRPSPKQPKQGAGSEDSWPPLGVTTAACAGNL
jgi:hypothetical protein